MQQKNQSLTDEFNWIGYYYMNDLICYTNSQWNMRSKLENLMNERALISGYTFTLRKVKAQVKLHVIQLNIEFSSK